VDNGALLAAAEQLESTKRKWGADEDVTPTPSTKHKERIIWKCPPSCVLIRPTEERYRVSYDMDLLLFQAGADASSEEKEDYLDLNLDGDLVSGVKIELPEEDEEEPTVYHPRSPTTTYPDDEYNCAYSTTESDKVNLSAGQQEDNATAQEQGEETNYGQAAFPPGDDTRTVQSAGRSISFFYNCTKDLASGARTIFLRLFLSCLRVFYSFVTHFFIICIFAKLVCR